MTLAEKITALRGEHKLSQGDLAEKLDVSRQSVSKWETGQAVPELDKIIKLADLFGVTVDKLVREGEALPPDPLPVESVPASEQESPSAMEPKPQIIYVERKGELTLIQKAGIVILVIGALMLFCIQFNVYFPIVGMPLIILSLPLIFARKHPFLIDGWLLCLGSCVVLNPRTSITPWGLRGGLHILYLLLTVKDVDWGPSYLFAASVAIVRGVLFLVLVFFTARLFFRTRAARKRSSPEEPV